MNYTDHAKAAYGTKPSVPPFRKVDAGTEQREAVKANLAIMPDATKLVEQSQDSLQKVMEQAIPGYGQMVANSAKAIKSQLAGEMDVGTKKMLIDQAAAQAGDLGLAGTAFHRGLELRDLGLSSMEQTQRGLTNAMNFFNSVPTTDVSVSSMFLTPAQRLMHETGERDTEWSRNWLSSQIAAAPDPTYVGSLQEKALSDRQRANADAQGLLNKRVVASARGDWHLANQYEADRQAILGGIV